MTTHKIDFFSSIKNSAHILWLSATSPSFYHKVYNNYKGYGFKYLYQLSFFYSLLFCIYLHINIHNVNTYLKDEHINLTDQNTILGVLPEMEYDGEFLQYDGKPIIHKDSYGRTKMIIDINNKLSNAEYNQSFLTLHKKNINVNILDQNNKNINSFTFKYQDFIGDKAITLNHQNIRKIILSFLNQLSRLVTYLLFPLMSLVIFGKTILDQSFLVLIIFIASMMCKMPNATFKNALRTAIFSCGPYLIVNFFAEYFTLPIISSILHMWLKILIIYGVFADKFSFKSK